MFVGFALPESQASPGTVVLHLAAPYKGWALVGDSHFAPYRCSRYAFPVPISFNLSTGTATSESESNVATSYCAKQGGSIGSTGSVGQFTSSNFTGIGGPHRLVSVTWQFNWTVNLTTIGGPNYTLAYDSIGLYPPAICDQAFAGKSGCTTYPKSPWNDVIWFPAANSSSNSTSLFKNYSARVQLYFVTSMNASRVYRVVTGFYAETFSHAWGKKHFASAEMLMAPPYGYAKLVSVDVV